jgi:hypothetical protein
MVDYSILEFGVYAFITYSSVLMLIISTIREIPVTKSMSISRAVYMMLGIITSIVLMGAGPAITMPASESTFTYVINGTTGAYITNSTTYTTIPGTITLLNGTAWMVLHLGIAAVLILFVIQQMVMLLFKTDT